MLRGLAFCACLLVGVATALPQNNDFLSGRIQNVFGGPPARTTSVNRGGFGEIVLPEPEDNLTPTQAPQILQMGNGACKCVPYWKCTPENNPQTTTDSRFFGEIDVRSLSQCNNSLNFRTNQ